MPEKPSKKRLTEEVPLMNQFKAEDIEEGLRSHSINKKPLRYHECCKGFTSGTGSIAHLNHAGEGVKWREHKKNVAGANPSLSHLLAGLKLEPEELVFVNEKCTAGKSRVSAKVKMEDEHKESAVDKKKLKT